MRGRWSGWVLVLAVVSAPLALAADETVSATWTARELQFTYQGFTARYSCDGLRDRMRQALLTLGARKDLTVTATGCVGGFGVATPFPGVSAKFSVLEPAKDDSSAGTQTLPAHWQRVDLTDRNRRDPVEAAGDCELIEQIKTRVLPLFATRNIDYQSTCIPHQLQVGGTTLKADVLVADPPGAPRS